MEEGSLWWEDRGGYNDGGQMKFESLQCRTHIQQAFFWLFFCHK